MTTQTFRYVIEITTDTQHHADQILAERIGHDEEIKCDTLLEGGACDGEHYDDDMIDYQIGESR